MTVNGYRLSVISYRGSGIRSFLRTINLSLITGAIGAILITAPQAQGAFLYQKYGTSPSGVDLYWKAFEPDPAVYPGTRPAVLVVHAGGFRAGDPGDLTAAKDIANAGFLALAIEYRLAPPSTPMLAANHVSPAQDDVGDAGHYPESKDDMRMAIRAARADSRCNGKVGSVGGSAGGALTIYWAATGTVNDDKLDVAVALSPPVDFHDAASLADNSRSNFRDAIYNYVNSTDASNGGPLDLASPYKFVTSAMCPFALFASDDDSMPLQQYPLMVAALNAASVTNYQKTLLAGSTAHAFAYWSTVKNNVIAFLTAGFTGGPPPPPTARIPSGISSITALGSTPQAVLDNKDIDGISLGDKWDALEATEGTFAWTHIDTELRRAAAAGKWVLLRIGTSGGTSAGGAPGNTPQWVIDTAETAGAATFTNGVFNATTEITSATANFTGPDYKQPVTGAGIPAGAVIATVNSTTSVTLSLSTTTSGTGKTFTIRGRSNFINYVDHNADGTDTNRHQPVFWDPTYLTKKKAMLAALGDHITNGTGSSPVLTTAEKAAVKVIACSFANAVTEDWNCPNNNVVDPPYPISEVARQFALGYTSAKLIDAGKQLVDATATAFPNQMVTVAVGMNGINLDAAAGGADPSNYVALTVMQQAKLDHPGQMIAQRNLLSAKTVADTSVPPNPDTGSQYWLVWTSRPDIGFLMLWKSFGDPTCRNGNLITDFNDGSLFDGGTRLVSPSANFTAADVGKTVTGPGIPAGTTISSVPNLNHPPWTSDTAILATP
jgi:acetyl esterase/lipase